jgi:hypothetical protein
MPVTRIFFGSSALTDRILTRFVQNMATNTAMVVMRFMILPPFEIWPVESISQTIPFSLLPVYRTDTSYPAPGETRKLLMAEPSQDVTSSSFSSIN